MMKCHAFQYDIVWQDKKANFARLSSLVAAHEPARGSLLVLPEMFATGFTMDVEAVVEDPGGATELFLGSLARQYGVFIAAGLVGRGGPGKGSNEALILGPQGKVMARYRKIHPFSYGDEDKHYTAGDDLVLFDWGGIKVCPLICYDLRFPEVFRTAVLRGAALFLVMANWPRARQSHWEALLRARAIENQAFVVGVNRIGRDPQVKYKGGSVVFDPFGETLIGAGDEEMVLSAEIDTPRLLDYRDRFPALRDIHPEFLRHERSADFVMAGMKRPVGSSTSGLPTGQRG